MLDRGKYLVKLGGCNDCQTPVYLLSEGQVPESQWLTGESFGWRGPWGTTYASNLGALMQTLDEAEWVDLARSLKKSPPMPWFTFNGLYEDDLRAIYRYARHLGPSGEPAPAYLPQDQEPPPPYALFPSPPQ